MNLTECFKIQILQADEEQRVLSELKPVYQVPCSGFTFGKEPTTIVADPFLFVKENTLYLFYESKKQYHPAVIKMVSTKDLKTWSDPVVVLAESFHLSFPWVFERDGHVYMIPETCGDQSVRLYEADDQTLTHFHFVNKLMEDTECAENGFSFSDTSIHDKNGISYLFTTVNRKGYNEMELYLSESFEGPYRKHPKSPISVDQKYARNAGCLFEWQGKLLRVAQDCSNRYGDNVNILSVDTLSPEEYGEHVLVDQFIDTKVPFYREGGHQLNTVQFLGKTIIATDAKEYHGFFWNRILHKLGMYRN